MDRFIFSEWESDICSQHEANDIEDLADMINNLDPQLLNEEEFLGEAEEKAKDDFESEFQEDDDLEEHDDLDEQDLVKVASETEKVMSIFQLDAENDMTEIVIKDEFENGFKTVITNDDVPQEEEKPVMIKLSKTEEPGSTKRNHRQKSKIACPQPNCHYATMKQKFMDQHLRPPHVRRDVKGTLTFSHWNFLLRLKMAKKFTKFRLKIAKRLHVLS